MRLPKFGPQLRICTHKDVVQNRSNSANELAWFFVLILVYSRLNPGFSLCVHGFCQPRQCYGCATSNGTRKYVWDRGPRYLVTRVYSCCTNVNQLCSLALLRNWILGSRCDGVQRPLVGRLGKWHIRSHCRASQHLHECSGYILTAETTLCHAWSPQHQLLLSPLD
eukprot:SAG22_NODE_2166_length_2909_cov_1.433452_2_plen_166_part_00